MDEHWIRHKLRIIKESLARDEPEIRPVMRPQRHSGSPYPNQQLNYSTPTVSLWTIPVSLYGITAAQTQFGGSTCQIPPVPQLYSVFSGARDQDSVYNYPISQGFSDWTISNSTPTPSYSSPPQIPAPGGGYQSYGNYGSSFDWYRGPNDLAYRTPEFGDQGRVRRDREPETPFNYCHSPYANNSFSLSPRPLGPPPPYADNSCRYVTPAMTFPEIVPTGPRPARKPHAVIRRPSSPVSSETSVSTLLVPLSRKRARSPCVKDQSEESYGAAIPEDVSSPSTPTDRSPQAKRFKQEYFPSVLYHYTDQDGMLGILEDKCVVYNPTFAFRHPHGAGIYLTDIPPSSTSEEIAYNNHVYITESTILKTEYCLKFYSKYLPELAFCPNESYTQGLNERNIWVAQVKALDLNKSQGMYYWRELNKLERPKIVESREWNYTETGGACTDSTHVRLVKGEPFKEWGDDYGRYRYTETGHNWAGVKEGLAGPNKVITNGAPAPSQESSVESQQVLVDVTATRAEEAQEVVNGATVEEAQADQTQEMVNGATVEEAWADYARKMVNGENVEEAQAEYALEVVNGMTLEEAWADYEQKMLNGGTVE